MHVRFQNVTVRYRNGIQAVYGAEFDVTNGEFVSIVGPSGCGRSTLLRLAAGLVRPSVGHVLVNERPADGIRTEARLAFVFQDATLLPWRSVRANIRLPLELERAGGDRAQRIEQCLRLVGLSEFARHFPRELSGGMRMRASLARAIVTRPQLLLLDEPFAGLDDITRQTLNEELAALWRRESWTALFVTHNIAEAVFLSQRVLVMSSRPGRIVESIDVRFDAPRTAELRGTARFAELTARIAGALQRGRS